MTGARALPTVPRQQHLDGLGQNSPHSPSTKTLAPEGVLCILQSQRNTVSQHEQAIFGPDVSALLGDWPWRWLPAARTGCLVQRWIGWLLDGTTLQAQMLSSLTRVLSRVPYALSPALCPRLSSVVQQRASQLGLAPLHVQRPSLATRMARTFLTLPSINNNTDARATLPLRSLLRSTQPALGSPCSTDATLTLLRSLWIRLLLQNAWWKGKVDWWKGRFQGLCGEDSEVPQRKGWLAGQYFFFPSLIPWRLSLVVFAWSDFSRVVGRPLAWLCLKRRVNFESPSIMDKALIAQIAVCATR